MHGLISVLVPLVVMGGCQRVPPANPKAGGSAEAQDTSGIGETSELSDSGSSPSANSPILTPGTILRGVVAPGVGGLELGTSVTVLPAFGPDTAVVLLGSNGGLVEEFAHIPPTLTFRAPLPRGDLDAVSTMTGSLDWCFYGKGTLPAGDVNGDGHQDVWFNERLHLGPLDGDLAFEDWHTHVELEVGSDGAAGFDADGDGHSDVLFAGIHKEGSIHYGPFEAGTIAGWNSADYDEAATSRFARDCYGSRYAALLPDLLGPGRDAIALGVEYGDNGCLPDTWIYDLQLPRGTTVTPDQAIATAGRTGTRSLYVKPLGDIDADGDVDVIYDEAIRAGPVAGDLNELPFAVTFTTDYTWVYQSLGDMNGDGLPEVLIELQEFASPPGTSGYFVLPSPASGLVDLRTEAVHLAEYETLPLDHINQWTHGDFDGDGLQDIVAANKTEDDEAGVVRIWYAADVFPQ